MAASITVKDYKNIQNPFERVSAQGVTISNEIVIAATKMNGFMEVVLRQLGGINKGFNA